MSGAIPLLLLQAFMLCRGGTSLFIFTFYSLVSNGTDSISLQDHLPQQTQEQWWCSRYRKMSNDIILIVHGCPISVFLFNCFLKTKLWNTFKDSECIWKLSIYVIIILLKTEGCDTI